jgi:hypothetical protein
MLRIDDDGVGKGDLSGDEVVAGGLLVDEDGVSREWAPWSSCCVAGSLERELLAGVSTSVTVPNPMGKASTQGLRAFRKGTKRGPFTPSSTESRVAFNRGPRRATMSLPACFISSIAVGSQPFSINARAASTNGCREERTSNSPVLASLASKRPEEVLIADTRMTIGDPAFPDMLTPPEPLKIG